MYLGDKSGKSSDQRISRFPRGVRTLNTVYLPGTTRHRRIIIKRKYDGLPLPAEYRQRKTTQRRDLGKHLALCRRRASKIITFSYYYYYTGILNIRI